MKHPRPRTMAEEIGSDVAALILLLEDATAVQWSPSRKVASVEDAGVRSKNVVARPTEDAALDPLRLALRDEVRNSARLVVRAHRDLYKARLGLERALDRWNGDPPE